MQVVIILMTYLTLLGVMALLKTQFLDVMSGLGGSGGGSGAGFGGSVDATALDAVLPRGDDAGAPVVVHRRLYQGRRPDIWVKFAVILPTIALVVWMAVG